MLNRAGALTCGGCHQFSNNQSIGKAKLGGTELTWPPSAEFVQIKEPGSSPQLSEALTLRFLPFRRWVLWKELCQPPTVVAEAMGRQQQRVTRPRTDERQKRGAFVTNRRSH